MNLLFPPPFALPPRIENNIESWNWIESLPELKNYLLNNGYEKILDLDEHNIRLAHYYQSGPDENPNSISYHGQVHCYFEIDENHIDFCKKFFASSSIFSM